MYTCATKITRLAVVFSPQTNAVPAHVSIENYTDRNRRVFQEFYARAR